jgi:hypothetical protein
MKFAQIWISRQNRASTVVESSQNNYDWLTENILSEIWGTPTPKGILRKAVCSCTENEGESARRLHNETNICIIEYAFMPVHIMRLFKSEKRME